MRQHEQVPHIALVTLVVSDYDEAIAFYVDALGFELREDMALDAGKRWGWSHRRALQRRESSSRRRRTTPKPREWEIKQVDGWPSS